MVGLLLPLSRYPRIIRKLPARSGIVDELYVLSAFQVSETPVLAPFSSTKERGDVPLAFDALFQCVLGTTPAVSDAPIAVVLLPTKSTLKAPLPVVPELTDKFTEAE